MASITWRGFCELAVLSRYTSGLPCTWRARMGKSWRMSAALRVAALFSDASIIAPDFQYEIRGSLPVNGAAAFAPAAPFTGSVLPERIGFSSLIFGQLDFILVSGRAIERDGVLIHTLDLPALLGIDPGISLALIGAAHALDDAPAQANAQVFQGNALQHRLKEALYDDALGLVLRNAAHHQVEELLFVDLAGGRAVAGADLVRADLQA